MKEVLEKSFDTGTRMQENLPQKSSRRARNGVAGMERERKTGGSSQEKNQQAQVSVNYSGKEKRRKKIKKTLRC